MFLLTRQLAVEERLAGGWGGGWRSRASSLSGAGTIAIVLFQDCELKMLELLGAQQKASKDFSSFLKLKTWRKLRVLVRRSRNCHCPDRQVTVICGASNAARWHTAGLVVSDRRSMTCTLTAGQAGNSSLRSNIRVHFNIRKEEENYFQKF